MGGGRGARGESWGLENLYKNKNKPSVLMVGVLPSRCTLGMLLWFLSRTLCWNIIQQSTYSCQSLAQRLLFSPRNKWPTGLLMLDGAMPSSGKLLLWYPQWKANLICYVLTYFFPLGGACLRKINPVAAFQISCKKIYVNPYSGSVVTMFISSVWNQDNNTINNCRWWR